MTIHVANSAQSSTVLGPLENTDMWAYTHSYGQVQTPANCSEKGLYVDRIARRLGTWAKGGSGAPGQLINRANSGYTCMEETCIALGTSGSKWTAGNTGIVIVDVTQNDMRTWPADSQGQAGYKNSLNALLALLSGGTRVEETDGSFTYPTGSWSVDTQVYDSGGTLKFCSTLSAQASIAFSGTDCFLFTRGVQANGGTSVVKVDGTTIATVNHLNQCQTPPNGTPPNVPIAVPLLGMSAGAHTITITKTDGDNTKNIYVDALIPLSPTPPLIVVVKQVKMQAADYTFWAANGFPGVSDASVTLFNGFIDTIAAGFPNVVTVDPASYGWNPTTCLQSGARHPNDLGMATIATGVVTAISTQAYRAGLNVGV